MPSANKKYEMQQAMTWNMRCLRSGFGKQCYSNKRTEPGFGIGSSNRDAFLKQYLSAEHSKVSPGNNSQGAVYKTYGSLGQQCESVRPNSAHTIIGTAPRLTVGGPGWVPGPGNYKYEQSVGPQKDSRRANSARATFGNETRDGRNKQFMDEELEKAFYGRGTPGPIYNQYVSVGKQVLSTKESPATIRIGTGQRFMSPELLESSRLPGAGAYNATRSALGKQAFSKNRTLPAFGFGTSTRDGQEHRFISMEHEKAQHGVGTPGPTTASKVSAFKKQLYSKHKTQPSFGFGTAKRLPKYGDEGVPGPGTYCA